MYISCIKAERDEKDILKAKKKTKTCDTVTEKLITQHTFLEIVFVLYLPKKSVGKCI